MVGGGEVEIFFRGGLEGFVFEDEGVLAGATFRDGGVDFVEVGVVEEFSVGEGFEVGGGLEIEAVVEREVMRVVHVAEGFGFGEVAGDGGGPVDDPDIVFIVEDDFGGPGVEGGGFGLHDFEVLGGGPVDEIGRRGVPDAAFVPAGGPDHAVGAVGSECDAGVAHEFSADDGGHEGFGVVEGGPVDAVVGFGEVESIFAIAEEVGEDVIAGGGGSACGSLSAGGGGEEKRGGEGEAREEGFFEHGCLRARDI